jgi:acyl-CoA-binding protein
MSEPLDEQFQRASAEVTALGRPPDNVEKLRLYGLFKQATQGNCTGERPSMMDFVGRAKYDSWHGLEGTPREQAMQQYIALVEKLKLEDARS